MDKRVIAIELSTSKVSAAVGEKTGDSVEIIAHKVTPLVKGIRHGEVENAHRIIEALRLTDKALEEELEEPVSDVMLCLSSLFIRSEQISIKKERAGFDSFITESEISSWHQEALKSSVNDDEAIFEAIPQSFNVDDSIGVFPCDVAGMKGRHVEGFYKLIVGKKSSLESKMEIAEQLGFNVVGTTLSAIGSARVALNRNESENGVALLDIGSGTTDVVIVKDNIVREIGVIPFGGQSITDDIKSVACVTAETAELIKIKYGTCIEDGISESKKLIIKGMGGSDNIEVHLTLLASIINARMCEIFEAATYIIEKSGYADQIPGGIVITGGTCYMENIKDLGRAITGYNIRLANACGSISDNSVDSCFDTYATSIVGAVVCGLENTVRCNTAIIEQKKGPAVPTDLFGRPIESSQTQPSKQSENKSKKATSPKKKSGADFLKDFFTLNNEV